MLTDATADIAIALMLAATRRMSETEAILRAGGWDGWRPTGWLGMGLQGKTLGIVGMGRIGAAMARRAALGFGMRVVYFNRSPVGPFDFAAEARPTVEAVLAEADVVSLHVPGRRRRTRGLISAERLAGMKPGAYLVNTARGDVVDEAALAAALESGQLAGAGLDVFAEEPKVPERLVRLRERHAAAAHRQRHAGDADGDGDAGGRQPRGLLRRASRCRRGWSEARQPRCRRRRGPRRGGSRPRILDAEGGELAGEVSM